MGVRARVLSLARQGVGPATPPRERKHIVFINSLVLVGIAMTALFTPVQIVYGDVRTFGVFTATLVTLAGILALNRRGQHTLAGVAFCAVVWVVTSAQAALEPREGSVHFFLLPSVILPYLALSSRHLRLAPAFAALSALTFLVFVYFEDASRTSDPVLYMVTMAGVVVTIAAAGHYARVVASRAEDDLDAQRKVSEDLLLNILPSPIADRLKQGSAVIADELHEVSVLFLDIVGFTRLATELEAEELVRRLNRIVSAFDRLSEQLGVEKIKTIGDGYMAAAGLPLPREDHARACAELALGMRDVVEVLPEAEGMQVRIGIATGSVIAGVIGESKFAYDLWGDTVNTAARMEETGIPGEIQISEETRQQLGDHFAFQDRGLVPIKGKGQLRTYLLEPRGGRGGGGRLDAAPA
jgi:class 3 adenylate cyclase